MVVNVIGGVLAGVIAGVGILLSVIGSAMVVSYRVGKVEQEIRGAQAAQQVATTTALQAVAERLARIEGMFELRLKDAS